MAEIKLEKFQGPLDLLLQLIEQEKMSVTEIALSQITEQYFGFLNNLEDRSEELADFLVIATRLVYLKSRQLLPYLYPQEEEGPSLSDQLKLYKRYADASKKVEELWLGGKLAYGRVEPPLIVKDFVMPLNANLNNLHNSILFLLKRLKPIAPLPQVSIDHTISVKNKIESIYKALTELKRISFKDLLVSAESKTEIIVSFLALLELLKQEKVAIHQEQAFEDMAVEIIL